LSEDIDLQNEPKEGDADGQPDPVQDTGKPIVGRIFVPIGVHRVPFGNSALSHNDVPFHMVQEWRPGKWSQLRSSDGWTLRAAFTEQG
jgi:hypothetical protein